MIYETFRPQLAEYGSFFYCPHKGNKTDCARISMYEDGPGDLPNEFTAQIRVWGGEVCHAVEIDYHGREPYQSKQVINSAAFARAIETHHCRIEIDPVVGDTLHFSKRD